MAKKTFQRIAVAVIFVCLLLFAATGAVLWTKRHDLQRSFERASLPSAMPYQSPTASFVKTTKEPVVSPKASGPVVLPAEVNLAVPFTAQAPHANWDPPYGEFCEEASIFMAMSYIQNEAIPNPDFADQKLLELWNFEHTTLKYPEDVTIAEVADIIQNYYKYKQTKVLENPTVQDIKQAVAASKLVIVPAAGRELGNPNFQTPGPLYHMFVIKGYTKDGQFITNDPGTRRGADFLYNEDVIMNAIHDWRTDSQIELGKKVVLIVG